MRVTLLYFAQLKDKFGKDAKVIDLHEGDCVCDLLEIVFPNPEERQMMQKYLRVAVNQEYTSYGQKLANGDEVVFIPPVAGG